MRRRQVRNLLMALCVAATVQSISAAGEAKTVQQGEVRFEPPADEKGVPEQFRLPPHAFAYEQQIIKTSSKVLELSEVTFPSPVATEHDVNNTVHCEYYRPREGDGHGGVVVLHILGGDFQLCRIFCNAFAQHGTAALLVKMPYYGPRRPPGERRRMVSMDPAETIAGMTQAVLDVRRAAAWLAAQDDVDAGRLGVFGISLGGITGALAATAEPRLKNVCLVLSGGNLGEIGWRSTELKGFREFWELRGGTREDYGRVLRPIDPLAYAENMRGRRILMINARHDKVVPPDCAEELWKAFGEPEIVWFDGGHYDLGREIFRVLDRSTKFYTADPSGR